MTVDPSKNAQRMKEKARSSEGDERLDLYQFRVAMFEGEIRVVEMRRKSSWRYFLASEWKLLTPYLPRRLLSID